MSGQIIGEGVVLHLRLYLTAGFVLAWLAVLPTARAPLAAGVDPQLRQLYQQILRDPTNTELNLRYARLAESKGELRKALTAYERILINDPDNREAQTGSQQILLLLKPSFTRWTAILGGDYASNARRRNRLFDRGSDLIGTGQLFVIDERRIGGHGLLQSES